MQAIPNQAQLAGADRDKWYTVRSVAKRKQVLDRAYDYLFISPEFDIMQAYVLLDISPLIPIMCLLWLN